MDTGHAQSELRTQRLLQREILAAARAFGELEAPELERLKVSYASEVALLRGLRVDDAEQLLAEEVEELEQELMRLEAAGVTNPKDLLFDLFRLGQQVRWRQWLSDTVRGESRQDPLSLIESELDWAARRARDVAKLDEGLQPSTREIRARVRSLRDEVWQLKVERMLAAKADEEDGRDLARTLSSWRATEEAFGLELDAPPSQWLDREEVRRGARAARPGALLSDRTQ